MCGHVDKKQESNPKPFRHTLKPNLNIWRSTFLNINQGILTGEQECFCTVKKTTCLGFIVVVCVSPFKQTKTSKSTSSWEKGKHFFKIFE